MTLVIHSPKDRMLRQALNALVLFVAAGFWLYTYRISGATFDVVIGGLFLLWGAYVLWHIISRRILFQETADGFESWTAFRQIPVKWDQLIAIADPEQASRIVFMVYKLSADDKDRYCAISRRQVGDDAADQILALANKKRPHLPGFENGKLTPRQKDQAP